MADNNTMIIDDRDMYVENVVNDYIKKNTIKLTDLIDNSNGNVSAIRAQITSEINETISLANELKPKSAKLATCKTIPGYAVAKILLATGDIKRLALGSTGYRIVAKRYIKTPTGWEWAGTYDVINEHSDDNAVMRALSLLIPDASAHDERSLFRYLAAHADTVTMNCDNMLVFFRNGVFNYRDKTLTAYDDPSYDTKYSDIITLAKLPVFHPYGKGAILSVNSDGTVTEPFFTHEDGTTWKPSDCYTDPFTDDETGLACVEIIKDLIQFTIRHMNGNPHLYHFWVDAGGKGHNGKSTLWEMIQRLIKKPLERDDEDLRASGDTVINCAIEDLERDYVLAQNITTAYAIVGEESNAATSYIENCAMVKMLSRAQEFTYRQIRQEPFSFKFEGALVQQCNKAPLFAEKTDSMYTHSVNIPFSKSFGDDRPYIKDDYINREEVAEWLAYLVTIEMPALTAYNPEALKALEPFKRQMLADSMSTMQALDEIIPGLRMNFMPSELLYDLYIRWCDRNGIQGRAVVSMKVFRDDLEQYGINNNYACEYIKKPARSSAKDLTVKHPALIEFGDSNRNCLTQYAKINGNLGNTGYLNADMFVDENRRGKLWAKGGLRRLTKWQDMEQTEIEAAYDEDAE